jgi:hypothetical protein
MELFLRPDGQLSVLGRSPRWIGEAGYVGLQIAPLDGIT